MSRPASPNVQAIEQIIPPSSIVTVGAESSEYLIQTRLGAGHFGVTYSAVSLRTDGKYAIKIQASERSENEANSFRGLELVEPCERLAHFHEAGEITRVEAVGHATINPTFTYQRSIPFNMETLNQESALVLSLMMANNPSAWEVSKEQGLLMKDQRRLGAIVMEYIDGKDLRKISGPQPLGRCLEIVKGIAQGVEHMHRWGFIHGDLKPENVMLLKDGTVKILDYSTTFREGEPPPEMCALSPYSPVQMHKQRIIERYSDLYGLGAIFYRLATGEEPFTQDLYLVRSAGRSTFGETGSPMDLESSLFAPQKPRDYRVSVNVFWEHLGLFPSQVRNVLSRIVLEEFGHFPREGLFQSRAELENHLNNGLDRLLWHSEGNLVLLNVVPELDLTGQHRASYQSASELIAGLEKACQRAPSLNNTIHVPKTAEPRPAPTTAAPRPPTTEPWAWENRFDGRKKPFRSRTQPPAAMPQPRAFAPPLPAASATDSLWREWDSSRRSDQTFAGNKLSKSARVTKRRGGISATAKGVLMVLTLLLLGGLGIALARNASQKPVRQEVGGVETEAGGLPGDYLTAADAAFNEGYNLMLTVTGETSDKDAAVILRNAVTSFQEAALNYQAITDLEEASEQERIDANVNAAIACWNIAKIYEWFSDDASLQERVTYNEMSLGYLNRAFTISAESVDSYYVAMIAIGMIDAYADVGQVQDAVMLVEDTYGLLTSESMERAQQVELGERFAEDLRVLAEKVSDPTQKQQMNDTLTALEQFLAEE